MTELPFQIADNTTDIVIIDKQGQTFHYCKFVLVQKSQYYKSMFNGNWKEADKIEFDLSTNATVYVLKSLLGIKELIHHEDIDEIITFADMKQFDDLKKNCETWLLANIEKCMDSDNVLDILTSPIFSKALKDKVSSTISESFKKYKARFVTADMDIKNLRILFPRNPAFIDAAKYYLSLVTANQELINAFIRHYQSAFTGMTKTYNKDAIAIADKTTDDDVYRNIISKVIKTIEI